MPPEKDVSPRRDAFRARKISVYRKYIRMALPNGCFCAAYRNKFAAVKAATRFARHRKHRQANPLFQSFPGISLFRILRRQTFWDSSFQLSELYFYREKRTPA